MRRHVTSDPRIYRWLQARLATAIELRERGKISEPELLRIETDATLGQYSGPLKYRDGKVSNEDAKVRRMIGAL